MKKFIAILSLFLGFAPLFVFAQSKLELIVSVEPVEFVHDGGTLTTVSGQIVASYPNISYYKIKITCDDNFTRIYTQYNLGDVCNSDQKITPDILETSVNIRSSTDKESHITLAVTAFDKNSNALGSDSKIITLVPWMTLYSHVIDPSSLSESQKSVLIGKLLELIQLLQKLMVAIQKPGPNYLFP